MSRRALGGLVLACLLAGCARYDPLPLPERACLAPDVAALRHDSPLPPVLGVSDIIRLALLNDPDLRVARARRGIAEAQLLQAVACSPTAGIV